EKRDKEEINPLVNKESLTSEQRKIADLLPNISAFMKFQVDAWDFINDVYSNKKDSALIVSAPTGFGKTEAVLPAVINHISNSQGIGILIFPRRALLLDQLERLSHYNFKPGSLRIGLQMDGIDSLFEWTIYNEKQKNISIQNFPHPPQQIDPLRHFKYQFETELLSVAYHSAEADDLKLKFIRCTCGGHLSQRVFFRSKGTALRQGKRDQHTCFKGGDPDNSTWTCEKCHRTYSISLSRDDHIKLKPNLIFTTIDSLPSLFSDPDIRSSIIDKPVTIVLDEIHVYYGSYGAHAASIISQVASRSSGNFTMIGLSATIDNPQEFGKKIFGKDTFVISPNKNDKKIIKDAETYYFIKSGSDAKSSGEFYSLKSQVMIQFGLLSISSILNQDETMLAFMDSVDAVSLLKRQIEDAYNEPTKRLHFFRLDGLTSKGLLYNQHSCNGFNPGSCQVTCPIYEAGECWNILRHQLAVTTPSQVSINSVWASALPDRTTLRNSRIIFSTSELELGIDLPNINHLVQYGAPYAIFNFLQRKGRAGRSVGSRPSFYFILGEKSNDFVYFSHGRSILSKAYSLPLNINNRVVKEIHKILNETYDESINEYGRIPSQEVELDYVRKYRSAWHAVLGRISPDFLDFLSNKININISTVDSIKNYTDMKDFKNNKIKIENLIKEKQQELNSLLINGSSPLNYLEQKKPNLLTKIDSSSLSQNEKNTLKGELEQAFRAVVNDIGAPAGQSNALGRQHQVDLLNLLHRMVTDYIGTELGDASEELYQAVYRVANLYQTLVKGQQRIRELFFLIQSLSELKEAVNRSLTSEIIKYVFRAQHFYDLSAMSSTSALLSRPPSPLPPTTYFSTSSREVIMFPSGGLDKGEAKDIRDIIYKYFPFRLNEVNTPEIKKLVQPRIERNNGNLQFDPREYLDGLLFQVQSMQNQFLLPLSLEIKELRDDGVNGIVSFCDQCFVIQDYNRDKCIICGGRLSKVRAYASPMVEVKTNKTGGKLFPIKGMKYDMSTDVMITLKGVELNLRYQYFDASRGNYMPSSKSRTYQINASVPYGYFVNTHSIEIQISPQKINHLIAHFRNSNKTRQISRNDILHTLAHLWVKTVSMSTGITDEFFAYQVNDDEQNPSIFISELQEGGAGYLEIFSDLISKSTNDVLENMHRLTDCEEHKKISADKVTQKIYDEMKTLDFVSQFRLSKKDEIVQMISSRLNLTNGEVADHYPTCFDGCPYCLGLSVCELGIEEQFDTLSLEVAQEYVKSLIVTTTDRQKAASMITNGGILVSLDGGSYGIFLL
ncbi:MAG: DEAD/DEAH box helicase, partial [Nitrososphaerota archaeon]